MIKPKILVSPDSLTWTLGIVAKYLEKQLSKYFDFTTQTIKRRYFSRELQKYDLAYLMFVRKVIHVDKVIPVISGAHGFVDLAGSDYYISPDPTYKESFKKYHSVHGICKTLCSELEKFHDRVYYTPYGVDIDLFKPTPNKKRGLKVGFAGNPDGYRAIKGYYDYIIPACSSIPNIELVPATGGLSHEQMPAYYNSIDVLICMSSQEGGPLPVLEAMSCEVPVISTNVGFVPEVVEDQENGLIINRSIYDLKKNLSLFVSDPDRFYYFGKTARQSILDGWTWEHVSKYWYKFFQENL